MFRIKAPPPELRRHPKGACFGYAGNGWYTVNFITRPRDIDSGILYVERVLNEALGATPKQERTTGGGWIRRVLGV